MTDLLGRPIKGDVSHDTHRHVEQWDEEKFIELLDRVFDAESRVTAVAWRGYTPYFADGEPCVYSCYLGEPAIAFDTVPHSVDYDSFYDEEGEPIESKSCYDVAPEYEWGWDDSGSRVRINKEKPSELHVALDPFKSAVEQGHFDNVMLEHFGDHAEVIATREGFSVEFVEHD